MQRSSGVLVLALAGVVAGAPAGAVEAPVSGSLAVAPVYWSDMLFLPSFDMNNGTLQGVRMSLSAPITSRLKIENTDPQAGRIDLQLITHVVVDGPSGSPWVAASSTLVAGYDLAAFDGTLDHAGASAGDTGAVATVASGSVLYTAPELLAWFATPGEGVAVFNISAALVVDGTGTVGVSTWSESLAGAELTVTYQYAPVPEPAAWALWAAGLAGLTRWRRVQLSTPLAGPGRRQP